MRGSTDFFISYARTDQAWAEWIAWQLEAEGYSVIVQAWDFLPGHDWTHDMHHGIASAERVIAVLSASYLRSSHGEAEWRSFYSRDPEGEQGLLLPVRVGRVEPPGLLKTRLYVDLVGHVEASARAMLLAAARRVRNKPTLEPWFPSPSGPTAEAPGFPAGMPPVWNVPGHSNRYFMGRDLLLTKLRRRLAAPDAASRKIVLTGLAGVGKTQLAVEYSYRWQADFDVVWWLRGEQPTSLSADYVALANQRPLAGHPRVDKGATQAAVVAAVRAWLERHHRWLLLFDNVEDPELIREYLPRTAAGQVLITSQAETGWEPLADPIRVDVLSAADATRFLLARTQQTGPTAKSAARDLADSLGYLPLCLEQAAGYITAVGTVSLRDYAELFATRTLDLLKRGLPLGYQNSVATTWSMALLRLQESNPGAVGLLSLAAFLDPDGVPLRLVAAQADRLPPSLAIIGRDALAQADAVAALRRHSLVKISGERLVVHRLLQAVVRAAMDPDAEREWASTALRLIRAEFPPSSGTLGAWSECERLLPHVLAVVEHALRLDLEAEARAWLLHRSAVYLLSRGQYRQALHHHMQALAGRRLLLGENHPDTLESLNDTAEAHRELGELPEALELHEQAFAAREDEFGPDDPRTLSSMNNVAETYRELGDPQLAHNLHRQALERRLRVLGNGHPETLESMHNLAEVLRELGRLNEALRLQEETVAGCRRLLGESDPDTLGSVNNLAQMLREAGQLDQARRLHETTLNALLRVLGEDHPYTLHSMHNLAELLFELGQRRSALDLHERALKGRQRILGDDHPKTQQSRVSSARTRRAVEEGERREPASGRLSLGDAGR
jgi:tetratricopeptide (TPR) repeat protein